VVLLLMTLVVLTTISGLARWRSRHEG
jgi:hypothetical protein